MSQFASVEAPETEREQRRPHVLFTLAGGTYAIPSEVILYLAMVGDVTPVPNSPSHVAGVTSIRGRVTPVVDLRVLFGFERQDPGPKSRLIVVSYAGRDVALQVDGAREFALLPEESVQPLTGAAQDMGGKFVTGMAQVQDRLIMVLDVGRMVHERQENPQLSAGVGAGGNANGLVQTDKR